MNSPGQWHYAAIHYKHHYYFIFDLNIKEFTIILREIISSAMIIVNKTSFLFSTSVSEELFYYLKLNILSVDKRYT